MLKNSMKTALPFALLVGLSACLPAEGQYQGLSPLHRAEVSLTRFAHDMRISEDGTLNADEQRRLMAFLARIDLRYGDQVQLDKGALEDVSATTTVVNEALYPYGLRAADAGIAIGAMPEDDVVRVVVTRHLAAPPKCPNFSQPSSPNYANAMSSNYSCSVRANLAAQVADPADLVGGKKYAGAVSQEPERAIDDFRNRALTGAQPLQANLQGSNGAGGPGGGGGQ